MSFTRLAASPTRHGVSIAGLVLILTGCLSATETRGPTSSAAVPPATATAAPVATSAPTPLPTFARNPAPIVDGVQYTQSIDPAMFVEGIDHPFFPMVTGATFVFGGDEEVEVEVLPDSKEILGVAVTVVRDRVFEDGELIEDTLG